MNFEELKKKHGEGNVIVIEFADGKMCAIKRPSRQVVGMAMTKSRINVLAAAEVVIENCWLDGDAEIKTEAKYLVPIAGKVDEIIGIVEAELKNL